jgi:metallo-beta-lactamase class B
MGAMLIRNVLVALAAAAGLARADEPPKQLACLAKYYALTPTRQGDAWQARLPDGTRLPWDDGEPKSLAVALDHADLEDTLARPYTTGPIRPITDPDEDPGRVRVDAIFVATYPKSGLRSIKLFGAKHEVHERAVPAFQRVEQRLRDVVAKDPSLAPWLQHLSGTYVVRNIAGTNRPSSHSYGVSVDLDASRTHYWRWQKPSTPLQWHNTVPQAIVDAFEAEGFIWGGRWYHYDTMHFEYRPELLDPDCRATSAARRLQPDPPAVCDDCAAWNQPHAPFRIFGNTYYVGPAGLSSVLIASNAGLILVDGGLPQSAPRIDENIRALGFRTEDIRLIVNGHAHFDHAGGIAALQRFTAARVATSAAGVQALAAGKPTPDDPQHAIAHSEFPPVANLHAVADGEVVQVGDVGITAHLTPGHTPGSTTWTWRACEGSNCLAVVYADSLTAVSAPGFRFTDDSKHPSLAATLRASIAKVAVLPCDIMIGAHPSVGDLEGRLNRRVRGGPNTFVDPSACRTLAARMNAALDARIADEQQAPHP